MDTQYNIKGIEKIIESASKEDLAKYYEVDVNSDFAPLILDELQSRGVPNGMEIAGYETKNIEEIALNGGYSAYSSELCKKYTSNGKAAIGVSHSFNDNLDEKSYIIFNIDAPISDKELSNIGGLKMYLGGYSTLGYTMGHDFYEAHKDEIKQYQDEYGQAFDDSRNFSSYLRERFDVLSGRKEQRKEPETYFSDWERQRAEEEKAQRSKTEQLISTLTGGKTIDQVSLSDLQTIKDALEGRQKQVEQKFSEKFVAQHRNTPDVDADK